MRARGSVRSVVVLFALAALFALAGATQAYAFDEPHSQPETLPGDPVPTNHGDGQSCNICHRGPSPGVGMEDCIVCHFWATPATRKGPHGVYSTVSDRCDACHTVHGAGGAKLLGAATTTGSCFSCHDGTGGKGVYGAIAARGVTVGRQHRVDTSIDATNVVPGGDSTTGGPATMTFKGVGGTLGCADCHSPHDANTVDVFTIERHRTASKDFHDDTDVRTNRLLRRNPGSSTATVTVYGADWCRACHRGRGAMSTSLMANHPVATDTVATYESLVRMAQDTMGAATQTGTLARSNRGFLMTALTVTSLGGQDSGPICQQCHEDARNVGQLNADGSQADPADFIITASDGASSTDNPRFQNFPHETVNAHMLVETDDDLCLNCHAPAQLP